MARLQENIKEEGQIVLLMDSNTKVNDTQFLAPFEELGISEVIFQHWLMEEAPNTFRDGSRPIDCIMVSNTRQIHHVGYGLADQEHWGDHRTLWFDIATTSTFGQDVPNIVHLGAMRHKLKYRIVTKTYVEDVQKQYSKHNIHVRAVTLEQAIADGL